MKHTYTDPRGRTVPLSGRTRPVRARITYREVAEGQAETDVAVPVEVADSEAAEYIHWAADSNRSIVDDADARDDTHEWDITEVDLL